MSKKGIIKMLHNSNLYDSNCNSIKLNTSIISRNTGAYVFNKVTPLSFKAKTPADKYTAGLKIIDGKVSTEIKAMIDKLNRHPEQFKVLGSGVFGRVYLIDGLKDYPEGIAVKVSYMNSKQPDKEGYVRIGADFKEEAAILKQLPESLTNSPNFLAHLQKGDKYFLIMTLKKGSQVPKNIKYNDDQFNDIFNTMLELDKLGIIHGDIGPRNMLIDKSHLNIIDYGSAKNFDPLKYEENSNKFHSPYFCYPSNLQSFERTLVKAIEPNPIFLTRIFSNTSIYKNIKSKQARNYFTQYLKHRAVYHEKRAEFIESQLESQKLQLTQEQIDFLKKAKEFESIQAAVLKNPSDEVINIEALKMQLESTNFAGVVFEFNNKKLIDAGLYKLYTMQTARHIKNALNKMSQKNLNEPELSQYIDYQRQFIDFMTEEKFVGWTRGLLNHVIDCLAGKCDNDPEAKDFLDQMDAKPIVDPRPFFDIAGLIRNGKYTRS